VRPLPPAPGAPAHAGARRGTLRSIAAFEGLKGVLAIAATLGLLSLMHHDLHHLAATLIGHLGLSPGDHYPALLIHYSDLAQDTDRRELALLAAGYVSVRFAEAYGLWRERIWGQWLGALSGALYVPFEAQHFVFQPSVAGAVVLLANLAVVGFLGYQLWSERRRGAGGR